MKVGDMYPSKYVRGADLRGPVTVTIARVVTEQMYKPGEGNVENYVLYTVEGKRGVVLSRILAGQIAQAVGSDDTDNWAGKKVTFYPQPMTVAGVARVAIRARAAAAQPANS